MSIKFLTDSACDITPTEAERLGVTFIPIQITFGAESYEDAVTLPHNEFYKKLSESKDLPITSQINPMAYDEHYKELTANGDEVVVITLSSGLSGTYQNAVIAAEQYAGKVFVVDGLNATAGQFILLKRGIELAGAGLTAEEIARTLEEGKQKIRVIALIDTLEYLKKGGRISAAVAFAGGALGIKPAIEVKNGKIEMAGTARGAAKGHQLMRGLIENYCGIDWDKPLSFIYSGDDSRLQDFIKGTEDMWDSHEDLPRRSLGGTIGTHIGPGAYGVAFFEK